MNEYDSARMLDLLRESHAAILVDDPAKADLLLLNTCSIREKAQEKVFHQLGRWRGLKQMYCLCCGSYRGRISEQFCDK